MLDQAATQALATGIKDAFASALPSTLSDEVRDPIIATYETLSLSIAQSINTYIKQAKIEVKLNTAMLEHIYGNMMAHPINLTVFGAVIPPGGLPPKVTITGNDIKNMVQYSPNEGPAYLDGTIS